ncbi:MAG: NUDIX domain-containing protein [Alphaproteobacteria bacterium]|nr:NUDIX domain-containing protein [Alphaproteobacteria bacterium]
MPDDRKVDLIRKETPFQGYFRVDRYHLRHSQFRGGMGPEISREVFERGHAGAVVPYDPNTGEIVLIEQFRAGALAANDPDPWLIEIVAGIIEEGETAENVVLRETEEEAGVAVTDLVSLGTHYMTPGGSSESIAFFAGRCDASSVGGVHGLLSEGEDIRAFTLPLQEAVDLVLNNRIRNATAALGILMVHARLEDLRRRWV